MPYSDETPSERNARIQRQHSQEMALRYAAMVVASAKGDEMIDAPTLDNSFRAVIDWFEEDISHSIQLRTSVPRLAEATNGEGSVGNSPGLSSEQVEALVAKIKATPQALHPMIKVKMTGMGVTSTKSLQGAVEQLSSVKAVELETYIDEQIGYEGGGE